MDRYLLVTITNSNEFPRTEEIEAIFGQYGALHTIISHPIPFHGFFCVAYKWRWSVVRCLMNRRSLYRKHGFIIEQTTSLQDVEELKEWSQDGGPVDSNAPSLLDLNDDCLLKIISFVPDSLDCVSIRLRQLCLTKYEKSVRVDDFLVNFNRVFHIGEKLKHLTVTQFNSSFNKILDLIFLRCINLESLEMTHMDFKLEAAHLNYINPQLGKLNLHECSENRIAELICLAKVFKNLQKIKISQDYLSGSKSDITSRVLQISSLTTVIIPKAYIDVGLVISEMPQLKVLSCTLALESTYFPEDHGLEDLYVSFELWYDHTGESDSNSVCGRLIKILKACRSLRCLSIPNYAELEKEDSDSLLSTIMKMPSLEGIYLDILPLTLKFYTVFADRVKILLFDLGSFSNEIRQVLARFSKLEVLSWNGDEEIDFFLENRQPSPLTIVSTKADVFSRKYTDPLITWVTKPADIFGPFCIFF